MTEDDMSPSDQLSEHLLARVSMLETVLLLIWNELPNRAQIRAGAEKMLEAREANGLAGEASDLSLDVGARARQVSFDAIFRELLSEKDRDELRTLSAPRPNI